MPTPRIVISKRTAGTAYCSLTSLRPRDIVIDAVGEFVGVDVVVAVAVAENDFAEDLVGADDAAARAEGIARALASLLVDGAAVAYPDSEAPLVSERVDEKVIDLVEEGEGGAVGVSSGEFDDEAEDAGDELSDELAVEEGDSAEGEEVDDREGFAGVAVNEGMMMDARAERDGTGSPVFVGVTSGDKDGGGGIVADDVSNAEALSPGVTVLVPVPPTLCEADAEAHRLPCDEAEWESLLVVKGEELCGALRVAARVCALVAVECDEEESDALTRLLELTADESDGLADAIEREAVAQIVALAEIVSSRVAVTLPESDAVADGVSDTTAVDDAVGDEEGVEALEGVSEPERDGEREADAECDDFGEGEEVIDAEVELESAKEALGESLPDGDADDDAEPPSSDTVAIIVEVPDGEDEDEGAALSDCVGDTVVEIAKTVTEPALEAVTLVVLLSWELGVAVGDHCDVRDIDGLAQFDAVAERDRAITVDDAFIDAETVLLRKAESE